MAQERKAAVTLRGNPLTLAGPEIKAGQAAPDFTAVATDLKEVRLADARGKVIVLSSVPSLDTPTCDTETRRFNQEAGALGEGVEDFRHRAFGEAYGVRIVDGPIAGVTARAVFVVGKDGKVAHAQYVKEIASEPDYDAVLSAARAAAK